MKKAKEYFTEEDYYNSFTYKEFIVLLKKIQIDTIKETVKKCANNAYAEESYIGYSWNINEKSILSVADKLIKKIK